MPSCSALLGEMACGCSVGLRLPPKSLSVLSLSIGFREVKGVGEDLEALPTGVGPLPTLLLQPKS